MMHDRTWLNGDLFGKLQITAERSLPFECAGFIVKQKDGAVDLLKCPEQHTARACFDMPATLFWQLRKTRLEPLAIYHSHPNGAHTLSARDRDAMRIAGMPSWPGLIWLIIPVIGSVAQSPVCYTWTDRYKTYTREGTTI